MKEEKKNLLFSNEAMRKLLFPLIVEQFLMVAMGMADTFMVASCGAVVAAQFMGKRDTEMVGKASNQLFLLVGAVSIIVMIVAFVWNNQILQIIYGDVEPAIMEAARIYFYFTAFSLPFLGVYNSGAALFRAIGNSKISMQISMIANVVNVIGNAILIYGLKWGVTGAAMATFCSRILSAVLICMLLKKNPDLTLGESWKVDFSMMRKILYIGIPSGVESSIFQVGKVLLSSLLAGFGTVAITANAVTNSIGSFQQIPNTAIGIAMITVIGQAIGANDDEQAKYYLKKLMNQAFFYMIVLGTLLLVVARPITELYHLSKETRELTIWLLSYNCISSMILVPLAFTLPNALRAAGDVRFSMVVSIGCMWFFRIGLSYVIADYFHWGVKGIWIAMSVDWVVRAIFNIHRISSGKWLKYKARIVQEDNR